MRLVYSLEEPPESFSKSIFLAGPTPRSPEVESWRPRAVSLLREMGYNGVVFVPENRDGQTAQYDYDYGTYPAWEHRALDMADLIVFWVPRDLDTMPAFTTNVEFGLYSSSGKALFGPPSGIKNRYLSFLAEKFNVPQFESLKEMLSKAVEILGEGSERKGGEREIPLYLWNTPSFQLWYQSQKNAGNRLDGLKVYWTFRIGKNKEKVFYWSVHPDIHITSENRNKINETVLSRFDISSAVLYRKGRDIMNSEIVLVREFRSPARNSEGFVWELPGGSSPHSTDPLQTISEEISEEVGLILEKNRFRPVKSRQMAATMSSHHGMLYSVELTKEEHLQLKAQKGIAHGADLDNPTGERAYTEVLKLREIIERDLIDWSNVGMILSVVR